LIPTVIVRTESLFNTLFLKFTEYFGVVVRKNLFPRLVGYVSYTSIYIKWEVRVRNGNKKRRCYIYFLNYSGAPLLPLYPGSGLLGSKLSSLKMNILSLKLIRAPFSSNAVRNVPGILIFTLGVFIPSKNHWFALNVPVE
jgi:hypothetical protein